MDFERLERGARSGRFSTVAEFLVDVRKIARAAEAYNEPREELGGFPAGKYGGPGIAALAREVVAAVEAELEARAVLAQQCEREIREEDAEREAALEARERERQARRRAAEEAAALAAAGGGGGGGGFGGGGGAEESAAAAGVGGGGGGGGFAADADADGANIAAANADATTAAAAASSEELWVQCSSSNQWRNISPAVHAATVASRPDDVPWLCAMDSERPGAGCHHPCDFELSKRLGLIDPNQQ